MNWRRRDGHRRPTHGVRHSGLGRRLIDLALAVVILGSMGAIVAQLNRTEAQRPSGNAMVNDGDTITLKGERIRLRGIDAPELHQACSLAGAAYPCGRQARDRLQQLIGGQTVDCEGWERDRFRRLLALCRAGSVELNRALVEQGWAVAFGEFQSEERAARQAARGLWAGEFDMPRHWRDTHGSLVEVDHGSWASVVAWFRQLLGPT
jgi:endonuclease YncB( thermonuclease family)